MSSSRAACTATACPQATGTLTVPGLRGPVSVVRDASGIPHISAANTDDLFFAQGFVQAQDRLFQMDLWKRASQGRLAEVLGSNFIERDAMTRRIRFRGDLDAEWAAYGSDTHRIATAFVAGINAWVRIARADLPEEFVLAGWAPELWKPEDLLTRIDAFLAGGNALDELFRARLVASIGAARTDALLPLPGGGRTTSDAGLDLGAITFVVPDAVRRIGTPPFVPALAARVTDALRPNAEKLAALAGTETSHAAGVAGSSTASASSVMPGLLRAGATAVVAQDTQGGMAATRIVAAEFGPPDAPSRRYLVHLQAPGWNVMGATAPWLPGVAMGHNDRIAWAFAPSRVDTQDIYVEQFNPGNPRQVRRGNAWVDMAVDVERIALKGRDEPFEYERQYTSNGVVIAIDKERHLLYTLRWSGTEPGGAGELAALTVDRAHSFPEFQEALSHWKMPTANFVYADVDGRVDHAAAGLVPVRLTGDGAMPRAGWTGQGAWTGWATAAERAAVLAGGRAVSSERLDPTAAADRWRLASSPLDPVRVWNEPLPLQTRRLLARLAAVRVVPPEVEPLRARLLAWGRGVDPAVDETDLFAAWVTALRWNRAGELVPSEFRQGIASSLNPDEANVWLDDQIVTPAGRAATDKLLLKALAEASERLREAFGTTFVHPLSAFDTSRKRFNVGPMALSGTAEMNFLSGGRLLTTFGLSLNPADWNQSRMRLVPGQSGAAASPHYDDIAIDWSYSQINDVLFDLIDRTTASTEVLTLQPVPSER